MSRTKKEGKRSRYTLNIKGADEFCAWFGRHHRGSTEKILRRNRKTWIRLGNKRRRRADKDSCKIDLTLVSGQASNFA